MKRVFTYFLIAGGVFCLLTTGLERSRIKSGMTMDQNQELRPNDWMMAQRMFPYDRINPEAYEESRNLSIELSKQASMAKSGQEDWEMVGPVNIGGRVTDVEMHPTDLQTIFICAASGGVWKSTDQGKVWRQVFENHYTQSTGDLGLAKSDKNIMYLGTGEPNTGQGSLTYDGYGVFKSTDAGESWTHVGLENAGGIGRVEVDPTNADRVFVAAMGNLFSKNPDRGVYRTLDGGATWQNVFFISDSTGAIDLCINPQNPNIIYASFWERVRYPERRTYGGPSSGLYRSIDGGDTWTQLTNGFPTTNVGRIGIDISPSNPSVLYASYSTATAIWGGMFKTTDGGDTWLDLNFNTGWNSYNWWFAKVQVHPTNPDVAWCMDGYAWMTTNGGTTWNRVNGLHVDQHALYSHPLDPDFVVIGNDGGVYLSDNMSTTNRFVTTIPMTQFYTCEVNYQHPEQKMGGTQDNGTPRTITGELYDWQSIYGGDGLIVKVDPSDDRYMYASSQYGGVGRSTNGGQSFQSMRPSGSDQWGWKAPYILDPNTPSTLYIASQFVYKSTNRGATWTKISNALTTNQHDYNYGTGTALAVSPLNPDIIYAGTDDGNVWVTTNGGANKAWTKVSDVLPVRWVTSLSCDPFDVNTAYVTYSGIRNFDFQPHLFRTTDLGATWEDISSNLPDVPINIIVVDADNQGTFYVATDNGVFVSYDAGAMWEILGNGMPSVPVLDINLHRPTRTLLAATFGRSMYRIPVKASSGTGGIKLEDNVLTIYPNPAQGAVNLDFSLSYLEKGKLMVFDLTGKIVEVIRDGEFPQGRNHYSWDGDAAPGTYIVRLVTDKQVLAKRVVVQ